MNSLLNPIALVLVGGLVFAAITSIIACKTRSRATRIALAAAAVVGFRPDPLDGS